MVAKIDNIRRTATMADMPQYLDEVAPEFGRSDGQIAEDAAAEEERKRCECEAKLQVLGGALLAKFTDVERKRNYIETRWLEDLRQYHGRYDPSIERAMQDAESCALFLNITKPKTHAFSARVMDMVLPTDDKNWGLKSTPVPELVTGAKPEMPGAMDTQAQISTPQGPQPMQTPEGAPVMETDIYRGIREEAASRAERMEDEIDDQLAEANHNAIQRLAIEQMSKLGTGIVMGPVITDEWRVTWQPVPQVDEYGRLTGKHDYVRKLVPNEDRRPGVQWVDCWNFYPDMSCSNPDEWAFAFVQYLVNDAEFRRMAKRFNFMEEPAKMVLERPAFNVTTLQWMNELRALSETQNIVDSRRRVLRYYGEIEYEDLEAAGLDPEAMGLSEDACVYGVVWLCDDTVLKVDINPLDSGEMPFSVTYCDKDEQSPFGIGIPRIMRGEQESVNSAWRMKHDNAGLSVGPQTIMRANAVTPADGDWHLKPKKMWFASDDTVRVSDVFGQFAIDSHQAELNDILQLAIRFADDVTQLPLIMQGDQAPHITQTAQGMSLLYNASTVVLRRTVKFYDDYMTVPLITRFYEWNMQFNPRDDIKGDMRAIARGTSTLLDKEQQGQALNEAMALAMQPTWQPYTDMEKLYSQALKVKRIGDIILPPEKIKENLEKQAQAAAAAAQAQAGAGGKQGMTPEEMALEQQKLQVKNKEIESRERIAVADFATKQNISLQQAQAAIAGIKIREDAANQRFNKETETKFRMGSGI